MFILKKKFKRKIKNQSLKKNILIFSNFGLKFLSGGILNLNSIEIIRRICIKIFSKLCKLFFRVFIQQAITKKVKNSRLGKGSGKFHKFIFNIKQGQILVELLNIANIYKIKNLLNMVFKKFSKNLIFIYNLFFRHRYFNGN
jgi:ribosomal protein L16